MKNKLRARFARSLSKGRAVGVCVALVATLVASPLSGLAESHPSALLSESAFDFGSVAQGVKVVREIEVKNTGSADLVIQRVSPSCGCTTTALSSPTVPPGKSEKIRISFDTSGFFGPKKKTVTVATNDPDNSELVFTLTGHVATGLTASPTRLEFGEVSPASSKSVRVREVSIEIAEGSDLEVSKIASLSKFLSVGPIVKQGRRYSAQVELLASAPKGDFRDRVIFEFAGDRRAPVNVPVTATVQGDIRVSPATVSFGIVEGGQVLERRVRFENKSTSPVAVRWIRSSDPAVSASVVEVQPGKQGVIVVRVEPRKVHGDLKATLELHTSHPVENEVLLNVYGVQPPK